MTRTAFSLLVLASLMTASCVPTEKPDLGTTDDTSPDSTPDSTTTGCEGGDEDGDGYCASDGDCDEGNAEINPGAEEICDGIDNNCDTLIDEGGSTEWYADADGDGFGNADDTQFACEPPDGYVSNADDCDDAEATVYLGADELCDGLDNDCNEVIDDGLGTIYYADADQDGYGDDDNWIETCDGAPAGYIATGGDCNDAEPLAWDGAAEACDGIDNDCNGIVDDDLSTTWYRDRDGDGYGDDTSATDSCSSPGREYIAVAGDCNDDEPLAYTGAAEVCDEVDNDCDGSVDNDAIDAAWVTADADGDGFGSATDVMLSCEEVVDNTLDCDDADANEPQVVDASSTSGAPDGSITDPWPTIQEGIDAAFTCVAVEGGTYNEDIDFGGANLLVWSLDGWASTIIWGTGRTSVVTFDSGEGLGAELNGFTIEGGGGTLVSTSVSETCGSSASCTTTYDRYYGGGIFVNGATPTLSNLWVTGNTLDDYSYTDDGAGNLAYVYSYGGGLFASDSSGMVVDGVTFSGNFADEGGGVYGSDDASFEMTSTRLLWNSANSGGGYVASGGTIDLTNGIVADNEATAGGGAWIAGGSSTWWNVTAAANDTDGVTVTDGGSFSFYSSSITDAATGYGVNVESGSSASSEYSNVYNNADGDWNGASSGTGDISSDPMFTNWSDDDTDNDDLSLQTGSALIDAGSPSAAQYDADGSRNDIGAYGGPGGGW